MKVLVVDEWIPWPLDSGKRIRTFHVITRLARWHEVVFLAFAASPADDEGTERLRAAGIRVIPVADDRIPKWTLRYRAAILRNLASDVPFSSVYHLRPQFLSAIREAVARERPDLVHCEWSNLAPVLDAVGDGPARVISAHNVESQIWSRYAENSRNPLERLVARRQSERIERLERKWYPSVEVVIAVSAPDARVIRGYGARVELVDNGVDVAYYREVAGSRVEAMPARLVFVASMDTFANRDAALWFAGEILPLIRRKLPSTEFWVVGKDPPSAVRRLDSQDSGVRVTGTVPDVREYLLGAALAVVPLRIGGGSRLKILESMAAGVPIVSTTVGAEGLDVTDGVHLRLADTPEKLAACILDLLQRPEGRNSLAAAARKLVIGRYDWDALAERNERVWRDAAARHRTASKSVPC